MNAIITVAVNTDDDPPDAYRSIKSGYRRHVNKQYEQDNK